MQLKIPPPVIGLLTAISMWAVNRYFPDLRLATPFLPALGLTLALCGLTIEFVSVFLFFRAKTTVNPLSPQNSRSLVTKGLYQYSRNPMYLGMLLLLMGFGLWQGQPLGLFFLIGFVWYITRFQIKPEEEILSGLFHDEYRSYCQRVRRWL